MEMLSDMSIFDQIKQTAEQKARQRQATYESIKQARLEQIRADGLLADYASDGRHNCPRADVKYAAVPDEWSLKSQRRAIMRIIRGYASGYYCRESGSWMIDELSL